jgi:hypothetical protein
MSDLPPSASPSPESQPEQPGTPGSSPQAAPSPRAARAAHAPRPIRRGPIPVYNSNSKRDTIIALASGGGVLLMLVVGFYMLQNLRTAPVGNKLDGVIVEKYATGVVEKEINVGGKKGLTSEETDSGFYFKIKVPSLQDRIFEVPVPEGLYISRKVGDPQSFIKPPSEQR